MFSKIIENIMIKITKEANLFLKDSILNEKDLDIVIYLSVIYPFTQYAHVNIIFCKKNDINLNDIKIDDEDLNLYIENKSFDSLKDSLIDIKDNQLMINAPNIYSKIDKDVIDKIKYLFENEINVMLSQHGGFIQLIDIINNDTLVIKFHGGCQGCGMVGYTLNNYIEKIIKKNFPQIKKIDDVTSHEIKDNSYY